ncbi:MAG TPA: YciI family protein [Usitatibacter sp.]|jgi:hypothetical protein|nr:YciI family protein [Usitatibacter sp.]
MRFLSMIRINENSGTPITDKLQHDMLQLMEELTASGQLVATSGLRPTKEGVRVRQRQGRQSVTDGPFTETKEVIGGYAIFEAKTRAEAVELTRRFLGIHGPEWDLECELREMQAPGDCG